MKYKTRYQVMIGNICIFESTDSLVSNRYSFLTKGSKVIKTNKKIRD